MLKKLFIILAFLPHFLFAQSIERENNSTNEIIYILQMDSDKIGKKNDINLKSNKFERHPLSGGDSLLVTASNDSVLYTINPDFISEIVILKNRPEVSRYTIREIQGLVIFKFKDEQQYLSVISNKE